MNETGPCGNKISSTSSKIRMFYLLDMIFNITPVLESFITTKTDQYFNQITRWYVYSNQMTETYIGTRWARPINKPNGRDLYINQMVETYI